MGSNIRFILLFIAIVGIVYAAWAIAISEADHVLERDYQIYLHWPTDRVDIVQFPGGWETRYYNKGTLYRTEVNHDDAFFSMRGNGWKGKARVIIP